MRLCLCYAGIVGAKEKYGIGETSDFGMCAENYKQMVFQNHEVDVFMHTWSYRQEKPLRRVLNPVAAIFEPQIEFDTSKLINKQSKLNRFVECSRFNSIQKSIRLALDHGKEYDFWMLSRYDILWERPIPWHELPKDKLIISNFNIQTTREDRLKPLVNISYPEGIRKRGYQDLWLIGNRAHMEHLSTCYDVVASMGNTKYSGHGILFKHMWPKFKDDVVFKYWYGPDYDLWRRKIGGSW